MYAIILGLEIWIIKRIYMINLNKENVIRKVKILVTLYQLILFPRIGQN